MLPQRVKAVAPLVPFMVRSFRKPEAPEAARLPFKVEGDELFVVSHLVYTHEVL